MPKSFFIFLFAFILCCSIVNGQSLASSENLVVNPSFETLNEQVRDKVLLKDSLERIVGWKSPTLGRAEIYNTDKNGWIEDKTTISGQRNFKARTGQRVARITTYSSNAIFGTGFRTDASWFNYHFTYLQNELSDSMVFGKKYYIGFWSHFHCLGTNNIGMAFSTTSVQSDTALRLTLRPKTLLRVVKNYDPKNIWHLTVDSFIADKAYKFIVIGNFFGNDSTALGGSKAFDHYFPFVDDVFVIAAKNNLMHKRPEAPPIAKTKKTSPLPKILNQVHFLYNSAEFDASSQPQLDSAAAILKQYLTIEIFIKGHTSSEGNADYNLKLSEKRAEAVRNYLIQKGIEAKRMTTQGFGETLPLVPDNSEENKRLNRRIEFDIVKE
jgi:outer membrane protein OmpA-like peptidoglycan-associated protein